MNKSVIVIFDDSTYSKYKNLQNYVDHKPTFKQLLNSIDNKILKLKNNYKFGNLVPKKYLTKDVVKKYRTNKIFRINLIGYWRLLYTLKSNEDKIIVFILDIIDHNEYNKIFRYRKK
ncbi:hypothetical protein HQ529_01045 [Candidatus Woesearchaeota archaeon]|nr:hypothetical protein [Candidatus Woesearchaeota archaeon]